MLSTALLDSFLVHFSEENPAGKYLKSEKALYRPLRNSYNIAKTSLHKMSLNPDPAELDELISVNQGNWQKLSDELIDILQNHSHDLESMVWLAMAQLFIDNPYGRLALSINIIEQSMVAFWPKIQPWLPDEKLRSSDDDAIARERAELQSRSLKLLFGESEESCQMAVPLRMLPLIGDIDYSRYQREEGGRSALRQTAGSLLGGAETAAKLEVIATIHSIQDVLDALSCLDQVLNRCFGELAMPVPGSRFLRLQLEANLNAIKNLSEGVISPWPLDKRQAASLKNERISEQIKKTALQG